MPPKIIENELDFNAMRDIAIRATAKQYEELPLTVLTAMCIIAGVKIKSKYSWRSGKTTYESKKIIVDRLFAAVHNKIEEMAPTGASSSSAAAAAAAVEENDTTVNFEWIDLSDGETIEVPRSTTISNLITIGLASLDGGDDGTGYVHSITVRFAKPGMQDANNDGLVNSSSDSETDLALGVRGCWVVRVFASFSRFCVSCFCQPFW